MNCTHKRQKGTHGGECCLAVSSKICYYISITKMAAAAQPKYEEIDFLCIWTNRRCVVFTLVVGLLMTAGGIIGLLVAPIIKDSQMKQNIPLSENSFAAGLWIEPPFDIRMQFWIFNTTNVQEILSGSAKPAVQEKGPYTYKQKNQKRQVVYGTDDDVSYIQVNEFYFDPRRSCASCKEGDVFNVPNAVYTSLIQTLRFQKPELKRMVNLGLLAIAERPFITKTVSQLLFNGFEDQLFSLGNAMTTFIPKLRSLNLPKKFQYFPKNETDDGRYEICVGNSDLQQMGSIRSWNGMKSLPWWNSKIANEIRGTDASLFPPNIKRNDSLPIFVSDMCRSSYLEYVADVDSQGLSAYRFVIPAKTFDTSYPENEGFCQLTDKYYPSQPADKLSCLPAGFLNLSTCRGSPMLLSMPHFLYAADEVVQSIDGLNPNIDVHRPLFDIQPTFGAAIDVQTKFQINVPIYPDELFLSVRKINPTVIPLFWFNAGATVDPKTQAYFYQNIVLFQALGYAFTFLVLGIGVILLSVATACCAKRKSSKTKRGNSGEIFGNENRAFIRGNTDEEQQDRSIRHIDIEERNVEKTNSHF